MSILTDNIVKEKESDLDKIASKDEIIAQLDQLIKNFDNGDVVTGTVVKVDRDEVLVDIGYKTEGVIVAKELSIRHNINPLDFVQVGETLEAQVLQKEDKDGRLLLSKKRAQYEKAWKTLEETKENDGSIKGVVIEIVRGGLIVDIGLRGFLPASLIDTKRIKDLEEFIGTDVETKIVELDRVKNNVVLSRKAWLEETQSKLRTDAFNSLEKGQVRKGVISSIVNFGAFVNMGGIDGLVHVSELSWNHIDHPSQVVNIGQEVEVEVIDIDKEKERVSLSLKATREDPWLVFAAKHEIGQVVPSVVTKLVPFGAFIRVEEGIEGLVHISELALRHVQMPEQVVKIGEEVFVKITDIDLDRRRISLSIKQANESIDLESDEFDPSIYGMEADYDDEGNYKYPEGFDPEQQIWLEGFEQQRQEWEAQYEQAYNRWQAHRKQAAIAKEIDDKAIKEQEEAEQKATEEALEALREKLAEEE